MNHENQLEKLANELKQVDRTKTSKISSWAIINSRIKRRRFHVLPAVLTGTMTATITFFLITFIQDSNSSHHMVSENSFIDRTLTDLPITYSQIIIDGYQFESMTTETGDKVILEPRQKIFKRGDVVYYKTPEHTSKQQNLSLKENPGLHVEEHQLSQIVGLPGETIAIKKGQIYINDEKLDNFYSFPTFRGQSEDEYVKSSAASTLTLNMKEFENMEPIQIPKGSVFVIGDKWSSSIDSRLFGPLSISEIQGRLVEYDQN